MSESFQHQQHVTAYLKQVGIPTNPDLSTILGTLAAPITYEYRVPIDPVPKRFELKRVLVVVHGTQIDPSKFGGLAALTNGVKLQLVNRTNEVQTVFPEDVAGFNSIKRNGDWGRLAGNDSPLFSLSGNKAIVPVRWSLWKGAGALWIPPGWAFQALVQDDLTSMTLPFTINVQGKLISTREENEPAG